MRTMEEELQNQVPRGNDPQLTDQDGEEQGQRQESEEGDDDLPDTTPPAARIPIRNDGQDLRKRQYRLPKQRRPSRAGESRVLTGKQHLFPRLQWLQRPDISPPAWPQARPSEMTFLTQRAQQG